MDDAKHSFAVADYVIFGLTLFVSLAIGLFMAIKGMRKNQTVTNEEFLLGGRNMPILPTALSLFSSVISGIALLSYPAEVYTMGAALIWTVVGLTGALIFSCIFVIPVIYRVKSVSIYKYLEDRFGSKILRVLGSVFFTLSTLAYMSVVLYSPAIALAGVTDVPVWVLILVVGGVCTTYTTVGGLKAVVWTDAFQSVVMYTGCVALVVKGTIDVGGPRKIWEISVNHSRTDGFTDLDPNPFQYLTVWTASIGGFFYWLGSLGSNQLAIQRYLSMPSIKRARILVLLTIPCFLFVSFLVFYAGFTIFAYYVDCDPIKAGKIATRDQLVIYYMIEIFGRIWGFPGLFLACLLSGTLSTVSSGINSLSAVSWEEFVRPLYCKVTGIVQPTEKVATIITRLIGIAYGFCAIGLAFASQPLGGIFLAVTKCVGALAGPLLGIMALGYLVPWANWKGTLCGTIAGSILSVWIFLGSFLESEKAIFLPTSIEGCAAPFNQSFVAAAAQEFLSENSTTDLEFYLRSFYKLPNFMYPVLGAVPTLIVGCIVSALTGCSGDHLYDRNLLYWTTSTDAVEDSFSGSESSSTGSNESENADAVSMKEGQVSASAESENACGQQSVSTV